jgi:chromosomal replication initiation ATPase DnaA
LITNQLHCNRIILIGQTGSGKTSLGKMWVAGGLYLDCLVDKLDIDQHLPKKVVVDNCDSADEIGLLHIINNCMRYNSNILMLFSEVLKSTIADLQSRLNASYKLKIFPPDPELVSLMIQHICFSNGIKMTPNAVDYIINNLKFSTFTQLQEFKKRILVDAEKNNKKLTLQILNNIYDPRFRL